MACIVYLHYPRSLCTASYTPVTSAKRSFQLHTCLTLGSSRRSGFTDSNGGVGQGDDSEGGGARGRFRGWCGAGERFRGRCRTGERFRWRSGGGGGGGWETEDRLLDTETGQWHLPQRLLPQLKYKQILDQISFVLSVHSLLKKMLYIWKYAHFVHMFWSQLAFFSALYLFDLVPECWQSTLFKIPPPLPPKYLKLNTVRNLCATNTHLNLEPASWNQPACWKVKSTLLHSIWVNFTDVFNQKLVVGITDLK